METADGQISTEFPSGAVAGTSVVTIKSMETSLLPDMPQGFKIGDTCFVIMALDEDGNEIVTLSQPSTITVKYSEADVAAAGGNPNRLVLAYWDEAAGKWKPLETDVDTEDMTLSASTTHLSTWAVMAKTTSASNGLPVWVWVVIGLAAVSSDGYRYLPSGQEGNQKVETDTIVLSKGGRDVPLPFCPFSPRWSQGV